jgi:hypothetical protein
MTEMDNLEINSEEDRWTYIWGTNQFTVHKAYNALNGHMPTHLVYNWLWSSKCQPKQRVFFWLLLHDKLVNLTQGTDKKIHVTLESYTCENYILQRVETIYHLFLSCNFAGKCWASIGITTPRVSCPKRTIQQLTRQPRHNCAIEIVILMAWSI